MPLYFRCKICFSEHASPINFSDRSSFDSSTLQSNKFQCPRTGQIATYDKVDMMWRDSLEFRAKSGNATVLTSGTVMSFRNQPITVQFGPIESQITLIFNFIDQKESNEISVKATSRESNSLELTLVNFKNPLGTGTTTPIEIGSYAGKKMFLHYRVYSFGDGDKTLHFAVFNIGEEVKNV